MEQHEHKNDMMCEWCGRHKDGRYMWLRLVLAILIGVFIFLAGIEIGQLRGEVFAYRGTSSRMMGWHNEGRDMMYNQAMPGTDGSTTIQVSPAQPTAPAAPVQQ